MDTKKRRNFLRSQMKLKELKLGDIANDIKNKDGSSISPQAVNNVITGVSQSLRIKKVLAEKLGMSYKKLWEDCTTEEHNKKGNNFVGETLREELVERGVPIPVFANKTGLSIAAIIFGSLIVTKEISETLSGELGTSPHFWWRLQNKLQGG